jgi:hypothetical protein
MKVKSPGKSERHFIIGREKRHRLIEGSQASLARPDKSRVKVNTLVWLEANHLNNISNSSSYLRGNTLRLRYKTNRLILFGEIITVYYENRTKHTDTLCGQNEEF